MFKRIAHGHTDPELVISQEVAAEMIALDREYLSVNVRVFVIM